MRQREAIRQNISEAREQLEEIEKSLLNPEYEACELQVDLEHAYHHLNYAWNIREESDAALAELSAENFAKWSRYPADDIHEFS